MADSKKHRGKRTPVDITEQHYRGTNEAISGFGYGAVETKAGMIGGVAIGAAAGAIMGDKVVKTEKAIHSFLEQSSNTLKQNEGIKRTLMKPLEWTTQLSKWLVNIAREAPTKLLKAMPKNWADSLKTSSRYHAGVTGAGIGALFGLVFATVVGTIHGASVARSGRKQFETAKNEIRRLRAENLELSSKYETLTQLNTAIIDEISEMNNAKPSTQIDAASVDATKRREDQTLALPPNGHTV